MQQSNQRAHSRVITANGMRHQFMAYKTFDYGNRKMQINHERMEKRERERERNKKKRQENNRKKPKKNKIKRIRRKNDQKRIVKVETPKHLELLLQS